MGTANNNTYIDFDECEWKEICLKKSEDALEGCGLSHDFFIEKFSNSIDELILHFDPKYHQLAIKIAGSYGYINNAEIRKNHQEMSEQGYCRHGINFDCCPAGCGG